MKKIFLIIALGLIDVVIFLFFGSFIILFALGGSGISSQTGDLFGLIFMVVILGICVICSFVLVNAVDKSSRFLQRVLFVVAGLIVAGGVIYIRDAVPSYFYYQQRDKEKQSLVQFQQEIPSIVIVGQPKYIARKETQNVPKGIDEYRFEIQIPINISKPFTSTQVLNGFNLVWTSQAPKTIAPEITGCYTDTIGRSYDISPALAVEPKENQAGPYTLIFHYNYNRNPNFSAYAGCKLEDAKGYIGQKIVFSSYNGVILRESIINNIISLP